MPITNPSGYSNYDSRTNSYRPVGLVSDGSASGGTGTDNTAVLQGCLTDAGVTKGTVIIPAGNYRVRLGSNTATIHSGLAGWTSSIQYCLSVPEGVQIIGQRQSKIIMTNETAPAGTHQCVILVDSSADDVSILGLTVEGDASTAATATLETGILAANCEDLVIRDVKVTGMSGDGIWLQGKNADTTKYVKRAKVQRCFITNCRGDAIKLSYGRDCLIQGNNTTTNLNLSTGGANSFMVEESTSIILTESNTIGWGALLYLKGTGAQRDLIISDNIHRYPSTTDYASMTLQTYAGIYTDASPDIDGISIRGNQADLRGVTTGTGTWLYLRGVTAASILTNIVTGGGGALTAFDVRGTAVSMTGNNTTLGTATTVTGTFGGGSSSKMSLSACLVPGTLNLAAGCVACNSVVLTGNLVATGLSNAVIVGNSITSAVTSVDCVKLDTCTNTLFGGNVVSGAPATGSRGILATACTRCHVAGNRVAITGTSTDTLYETGGTKNSCHSHSHSASAGAPVVTGFTDTANNYNST